MQPEKELNGTGQNSAEQGRTVVCTQCGKPMPEGMRFCRSCGQRLGEGTAEYTETVRLPHGTAAADSRATTQFVPGYRAPIAQQTGGGYPSKRRLSGMTWIFIAIAIFFGVGGLLSTVMKNARSNIPRIARSAPDRSYFGVDGFEDADGGATFDAVEPPGSPADKAGLVGGDIITSFDGRPVKGEDEMMDLLRQTPVGKTVEVVYLRDSEIKKTQMTTISIEASNELKDAFDNRAEGHGRFGFDDGDAKSVDIPGMKIRGVQLGEVSRNLPADMAGIKEGDIVIEFDDVPIRTPDELASRVRRVIPYTTVNVALIRDGQRLDIPVKMGKR